MAHTYRDGHKVEEDRKRRGTGQAETLDLSSELWRVLRAGVCPSSPGRIKIYIAGVVGVVWEIARKRSVEVHPRTRSLMLKVVEVRAASKEVGRGTIDVCRRIGRKRVR